MLTASLAIRPVDITAAGGIPTIENTVLKPVAALRDSGLVTLTDFTTLVTTWRRDFGARGCTYRVTP
jgi:hypothetical protein